MSCIRAAPWQSEIMRKAFSYLIELDGNAQAVEAGFGLENPASETVRSEMVNAVAVLVEQGLVEPPDS